MDTKEMARLIDGLSQIPEIKLYKAEDIQTLRQIQHLVNVKGLKLEGVEKELRAGHSNVDKTVKAITSLKEIRSQLVQVRELL